MNVILNEKLKKRNKNIMGTSEIGIPVAKISEMLAFEDDSTDSIMDKVLIHLEKLNEEDDEYMQLLLERLKSESIYWEQPWYQQSVCLTRPLQDRNNFTNPSETFRTDRITKAESDRIDKNWRKLRKKFDIPDKPICLARWRNTDKCRSPTTPEERVRKFVIAYLAKGLQRNLYQVYKHFVTHYGCPVKGSYDRAEEKIMETCFQHHPQNCVKILSTVLGREPRGIYKKLDQMYNGKVKTKKLKWTLPLATKFLKHLMKYSGLSLEELKYRQFDKLLWDNLQEEMKHPYVHLQRFWYSKLHVQIFVKTEVKLNRLRKKIFKKLRSLPCKIWTDIRWRELLQHFPDGCTHSFLNIVARRVFRDHSTYLNIPLHEAIDYALNKVRNSTINKRLKTLELTEDGNLVHVQYNN